MSTQGGRSGNVVLVHGIFDTGRIFGKMSSALATQGFTPFMPDLSPNSGRSGLEHLAQGLRDYVERHLPPDQRFSLVGFSMGGVIGRYYLQRLGGSVRVEKFITLSSPHHGSVLAYALRHKGSRQLRPGSDFLNDLNRDLQVLDELDPVSIWTPFDLMVVPAGSSRLPSWREIRINVPLHSLMLRDRKCIDAVLRELGQR